MPVPTNGPSIHDLVIDDLARRKEFGLARYGSPLQAFNGRDALNDLYEELMDALVYLKQAMIERDSAGTGPETIQREAHHSRLRRHLVDKHGYAETSTNAGQIWDTSKSLAQEHLEAHRLLKKDHEYHPWGEQ